MASIVPGGVASPLDRRAVRRRFTGPGRPGAAAASPGAVVEVVAQADQHVVRAARPSARPVRRGCAGRPVARPGGPRCWRCSTSPGRARRAPSRRGRTRRWTDLGVGGVVGAGHRAELAPDRAAASRRRAWSRRTSRPWSRASRCSAQPSPAANPGRLRKMQAPSTTRVLRPGTSPSATVVGRPPARPSRSALGARLVLPLAPASAAATAAATRSSSSASAKCAPSVQQPSSGRSA